MLYHLPTEITPTFAELLHTSCEVLNMLKHGLIFPKENKRDMYKNGKLKLNLFSSNLLRSPCGRRQLQLEPWRPHWSTPTHTSTFPFHGPRGAAARGSPPACLETPSKPGKSRREDRSSNTQLMRTEIRIKDLH